MKPVVNQLESENPRLFPSVYFISYQVNQSFTLNRIFGPGTLILNINCVSIILFRKIKAMFEKQRLQLAGVSIEWCEPYKSEFL